LTGLRQAALPNLSTIETVFAIILIFLHAMFFLPLSAQTNLDDIKRFSILYLFVIALQLSLVFLIPNPNYSLYIFITITLSFVIQCLGVSLITFYSLKDKVWKSQK
jgi:hypothetical protein